MRVLVTGASGFIGRNVVRQLASAHVEVIGASRSTPADSPPNVCWREVDLLLPGAARRLVTDVCPTHLVHLAWDATPGSFWAAPTNLDWAAATLVLTRAFAESGGVRAIYAGSCAEYGWNDKAVLSEDDEPQPATFYGRVKDSTRRAVQAAGEALGFSWAWARVFWLYGPGEARGRLVSDVGAALAEGREIACSEGLHKRDFLHVEDVAGAFVKAISSEFEGVFNVGSGESVAIRHVIETLARGAGRPELVRFGARPSGAEPPELVADVGRLHDHLQFTPRRRLSEGLVDVAAWWRARRPV